LASRKIDATHEGKLRRPPKASLIVLPSQDIEKLFLKPFCALRSKWWPPPYFLFIYLPCIRNVSRKLIVDSFINEVNKNLTLCNFLNSIRQRVSKADTK
jgi:hypothetical protein